MRKGKNYKHLIPLSQNRSIFITYCDHQELAQTLVRRAHYVQNIFKYLKPLLCMLKQSRKQNEAGYGCR